MERIFIKDTPSKIGEGVKVCGWVNSRRDQGKIIFIDLRDSSGILQCVFSPDDKELLAAADVLRPEWVVEMEGEIVKRPAGMVNPSITTGEVELKTTRLEVFNKAQTPPFALDSVGTEINEELRMQYRYLDLRRPRLQNNLKLRHQIIQFIRNWLSQKGFVEVETPILTKSTPEGARDYVVPSRQQPGKFYALPHSPQQFKQLMMVAGLERFFQIARCFRDEDTRGDRQPEFTQLDLEMSFVSQSDILDLTEQLYTDLVYKLFPEKRISQTPFPRLTYQEAIEKWQSDKPDLRKNKEDPNELAFVFVIDFPMFEKKGDGSLGAVHHPFTLPQTQDIGELKKDPLNVLAYQHDLVLNGYEIGGGSMRIHQPELLEAVFEILGHTKAEIQDKFGHMLEAFRYGVPPHGGIAPGIDRLIMVLQNEPNIREVIAFPKTGDGRDPMMGSPAEVSKEQLRELGIGIIEK
ncbi:MAG: aspartate--tRNA ligase [Parcubacteria group bacterium]|nr:aspartate--tRNA ligase [Parcubacteria group bacterium]